MTTSSGQHEKVALRQPATGNTRPGKVLFSFLVPSLLSSCFLFVQIVGHAATSGIHAAIISSTVVGRGASLHFCYSITLCDICQTWLPRKFSFIRTFSQLLVGRAHHHGFPKPNQDSIAFHQRLQEPILLSHQSLCASLKRYSTLLGLPLRSYCISSSRINYFSKLHLSPRLHRKAYPLNYARNVPT